MTKGRIVGIKRFEIHDGDGIRTTLFLKGCPLKCKWCHNPEAISLKPQVAYLKEKCIGCGECVSICSAHSFSGGKHVYNRNNCVCCGRCENVCFGEALTFYGKEVSPKEILPLLTEDRIFYEGSGGGVTLSGGEPLFQADFSMELLKLLKAEGIHTAVDTCGFAGKDGIDKIIQYTDLFLYDIKFYDDKKHIQYTGCTNKPIIENLKYIDSKGKPTEVRIPLIPAMNDDQVEPIGRFLSSLKHIVKVKLLPYYNFSSSKYEALEMENTLPVVETPDDYQLTEAVSILKSFELNVVSWKE
jgi:pyruvate formate lyase activating enzyme